MAEFCDSFLTIKLPRTGDPFNHGMREVIDVRTPLEYKEDHIPGSINLPVLTNAERHSVGKEHALNSFEARRTGAALISTNISGIISNHFQDKPKTHSCLIYCWRGGQRSRSLALVLSMIGFNVTYLKGGYKTYRKIVLDELPKVSSQFSYKVIGGMTGCGKTLLLRQLKNAGEQVLDLEAMANHRGSVLGINYNDVIQPNTKMFESNVLQTLKSFNPAYPVWVESEGKRIGNVQISNDLFKVINSKVAERYELKSSVSTRVRYLLREYEYLTKNPDQLRESLVKLSKYNVPLKKWYSLIDSQRYEEFVLDMLKNHYDPLYRKSQPKSFVKNSDISDSYVINLDDISEEYLDSVILPKHFLNKDHIKYDISV